MQFHKIIEISENTRMADHADEQKYLGSRKGDSSVMLSVAKQLPARRDRPFAALRVTGLAGAPHTNLGTSSR